jgi:hypothetical protein
MSLTARGQPAPTSFSGRGKTRWDQIWGIGRVTTFATWPPDQRRQCGLRHYPGTKTTPGTTWRTSPSWKHWESCQSLPGVHGLDGFAPGGTFPVDDALCVKEDKDHTVCQALMACTLAFIGPGWPFPLTALSASWFQVSRRKQQTSLSSQCCSGLPPNGGPHELENFSPLTSVLDSGQQLWPKGADLVTRPRPLVMMPWMVW